VLKHKRRTSEEWGQPFEIPQKKKRKKKGNVCYPLFLKYFLFKNILILNKKMKIFKNIQASAETNRHINYTPNLYQYIMLHGNYI